MITDQHRKWETYIVPATPEDVIDVTSAVARSLGLVVSRHLPNLLRLEESGQVVGELAWNGVSTRHQGTLGYQTSPQSLLEVIISQNAATGTGKCTELVRAIRDIAAPFNKAELDTILRSMPMVQRFSTHDSSFDSWAVIFRDHYLEHSVGFLLGLEQSGVPAKWILALSKGDRTRNRHRVHATFLARGYQSDTLDNTAINAPSAYSADIARARKLIDSFIDSAHESGRRILLVDDGGLIACGYAKQGAERCVSAAVELTVSGLKRIAAGSPLAVPVINMARSQIKTLLGYPEIADSCVRRLRSILPDRKFIGRPILLLGYGALGSRIAHALRALGVRVTVVDTNTLTLIAAAESGFNTHRSVASALRFERPFLIVGTTGEQSLSESDIPLLPDGIYLAPFATRDFSVLLESSNLTLKSEILGVGNEYQNVEGRSLTLLGDGRSMNLFEADSIPNEGYDAYRAATIVAAKNLCRDCSVLPNGMNSTFADEAIMRAGFFETYYDLHFGNQIT